MRIYSLLIMSGHVMGWAIVWVAGGPRPNPDHLCLSVDSFNKCLHACGTLCRRVLPYSYVRPPKCSTL